MRYSSGFSLLRSSVPERGTMQVQKIGCCQISCCLSNKHCNYCRIVINVTGISSYLSGTGLRQHHRCCDMMGQAIGPLILIVIGFALVIVPKGLKDVIITCIVRLPLRLQLPSVWEFCLSESIWLAGRLRSCYMDTFHDSTVILCSCI